MSDTKALTVRLPATSYSRAQSLAAQRGVSLNRLVLEALEEMDRRDREERLFDDFTLLGEDDEGSSVEFAQVAQFEATEEAS